MFLSDHHAITITLSFLETDIKTKIWHLNPSLLKDPSSIDYICTHVRKIGAQKYLQSSYGRRINACSAANY